MRRQLVVCPMTGIMSIESGAASSVSTRIFRRSSLRWSGNMALTLVHSARCSWGRRGSSALGLTGTRLFLRQKTFTNQGHRRRYRVSGDLTIRQIGYAQSGIQIVQPAAISTILHHWPKPSFSETWRRAPERAWSCGGMGERSQTARLRMRFLAPNTELDGR